MDESNQPDCDVDGTGSAGEPPAGRLSLPARLLIGVVTIYQRGLSPLLGANCRYQPTCSRYMIEAVRKYGAVRGGMRGVLRILRCHPFRPGGYDPP
ncbi:MAG: membrane protein insertion efficiency factor YidD [Planctomycetota bacterium]|nr:MAG: membrane protein insertion efficiency factor YidD [Planctomycetota bacterium]